MLGWEYPPHISGGLGTACQGLTSSLAGLGVEIDFVVPRFYGDEDTPHMRLWGASDMRMVGGLPSGAAGIGAAGASGPAAASSGSGGAEPSGGLAGRAPPPGIAHLAISAALLPYLTPEAYDQAIRAAEARLAAGERLAGGETKDPDDTAGASKGAGGSGDPAPRAAIGGTGRAPSGAEVAGGGIAAGEPVPDESPFGAHPSPAPAHYGGDLFSEVARYAENAVALAAGRAFDLVHAHDWLTWPAGIALARAKGVPFVAHAHSLEYDRSGQHANPRIFEVERAGLRAADRVIAVSFYTRGVIHQQHAIPLDRISVVHNGVYTAAEIASYRAASPGARKTVLFLGRVTFQKGPEYFVRAAAKVVPHVPDVEFVVAGSGDLLPRLMELVGELGLARHFRFTGFLKGAEVERMFSMADLYVMPSVSEPFGISALEAMSYDTPVILSKQSGASEVLQHALKVDFWDVDHMANLIIGALSYPELRADIVAMAREEVRRIHWDAAALATLGVYRLVLGSDGEE